MECLKSPGKQLLNDCTSYVSTSVMDTQSTNRIIGMGPISQVCVIRSSDTESISKIIGSYTTTYKYNSKFNWETP